MRGAEYRHLYTPQPRQNLLHEARVRQVIFGGAAGGGKSHACRWDLIWFALENPGFQGYLFRRTRRMLESTHIRAIKRELANLNVGKYNGQRNAFEFSNGSILYMCYCDIEDDVYGYLSEEMHACLLDEASQFTAVQIGFLKTRVRLGGWKPTKDAGILPRFVMATNPGGPGHDYIKSLKDRAEPEKVFHDPEMRDPRKPEDKGWTTMFVPSFDKDNAYLDEDYGAAFGMLSPEMQRAYREGDWDIVLGAALHNLSRTTHQLPAFTPPRHWLRFMSMDWGMARPFSIGWYAVCDDDVWIKGKSSEGGAKLIPRGAVVRYRELYGHSGLMSSAAEQNKKITKKFRPNAGCFWPPAKVASEIHLCEKEDTTPTYRVADTEIWSQHGGPCVAEMFSEHGIHFIRAKKDRIRNYGEVIARLAGEGEWLPGGRMSDRPMFFVTANCLHWWRTVPILELDPLEPEKGPGTKNAEDHCYDETAYGLRSRPYIPDYVDDEGENMPISGQRAPYVGVR